MITTTEDKFDVDYDVFSFAGRTALMAGGVYALDQSIRQDVFKKGPSNIGKYNNEYINRLSNVLQQDDVAGTPRSEKDVKFKNDSFFSIPTTGNKYVELFNVHDDERVSLKKLLDNSGYKGMSKDLFDEIDALQNHIRSTDKEEEFFGLRKQREANGKFRSGAISLKMDKKGKLLGISMDSLAGRQTISVVDKDGMVTLKDNKYLARPQFTNIPGFKPSDAYGVDVAHARFLKKNYVDLLRGKLSSDEIKSRFNSALTYAGKLYDDIDDNRLNPAVVQNILGSARDDVFSPMGNSTRRRVMEYAATKGAGVASAKNLADGIIRLMGDKISEIDGLGYTSNPNQIFRANTFYIDPEGKQMALANLNFAFLDDKQLSKFQEIAKRDYNWDFGDLAKEEMLANSRIMGMVGDNTRSIGFKGDQRTEAADYLLTKMVNISGVSKEEFIEKIRQGGFNAFEENTRKRLKSIGIDDYSTYIRRELQLSLAKRKALMQANKGVFSWGSNPDEITFFKEAENLKAQGKISEAMKQAEEEVRLNLSNFNQRKVLGRSKDGQANEVVDRKLKGLTIDNLHFGNDGSINMSLLRTSKIGQGIKGIDPSGETKAVYKSANEYVSEILMKMHEEMEGSISSEAIAKYANVHAIAKAEAMKSEITDRNLYDALFSIREKNKLDSNKDVSRLINEFDQTGKTNQDYEKLFRGLGETVGGDFTKLTGDRLAAGFIKSKLSGFGSAAMDLGAGDLGFVAERHIELMLGSNMNNFAASVVKRKINVGTFRSFKDLERTQTLLNDSARAGFINFNNMDDLDFNRFMDEVFPSVSDSDSMSAIKNRATALSKYGKIENGASFVSLGTTVEGINKIPIFTDENLMGLIGEQIGYDGDYKKYTEVDRLTKDILRESRMGEKDSPRLKTLIKNYKEAISHMNESLRSKILKGKVTQSMTGQATSGSAALNKYADDFFSKGIRHSAPSVAAVSKKQYVSMFGQEAYDHFIKTKKSKAWAFAIREPVEGLSGLPVNVVPSDTFDGIRELDDTRVALVANRQNSILNMVFGDYDGDQLSLIGASKVDGKGNVSIDEASSAEISRLATSNDDDAVAFRQAQEVKTKFQLKGAHSKSILSNDLASLTLSNYYAKDLEKGFVGIASNSLKGLHAVNRKINKGDDFYRTETILHTFAENIIKAKAQSTSDLQQKRAQKVLDALVAGQEFKTASITDRIKMFRQFADEVMLGDASPFADRIRAGENTAGFIDEISKALNGNTERANDIVNGGWFNKTTNDYSMQKLIEVSGLSQRGSDQVSEAVENIFAKELGESRYRLTQLAEETQEAITDSKKMLRGLGGNLTKYALLPAAAFGVLGTVFGARSSVTSDVEFSDNQQKHNKSNGRPWRPMDSVNMKQPTHMKPEVTGQARTGFKIDKYAATHRTGEMRIQDDSRNFDYHDMEDKMRKGY